MASLRSLFKSPQLKIGRPDCISYLYDNNNLIGRAVVEEVVDLLVNTEIPHNAPTRDIHNKMTIECINKLTQLLLTHPGCINLQLADGSTVLHYAVSRDNPTLVNFLLNNGANVENIYNKKFYSAIHVAILLNRIKCFSLIHQHIKGELVDNANKPWFKPSQLHPRYTCFAEEYLNFHLRLEPDTDNIYRMWLDGNRRGANNSESIIKGTIHKLNTEAPDLLNIELALKSSEQTSRFTLDVIEQFIRARGINGIMDQNRFFINELRYNTTLLTYAVVSGYIHAIDRLLMRGADLFISINLMDYAGSVKQVTTPLELAFISANKNRDNTDSKNCHPQILQLLLKHTVAVKPEVLHTHFFSTAPHAEHFKFVIKKLLPYIHITYGEERKSILSRVNTDPNVSADIKNEVFQYCAQLENVINELSHDTASFLAKLPGDIINHYIQRLLVELPPVDNTTSSHAARAAAEGSSELSLDGDGNHIKQTMRR